MGSVKGHDIQSGPNQYVMKEDEEKSDEEGGITGEQVPSSPKGG